MNAIQVLKVGAEMINEFALGIALVYQEVFGGEPWNEGYKCPECQSGIYYPLSTDQKLCPECANSGKSTEMVECWPIEQIISDFKNEMRRPNAVCFVALSQSCVVGFTWGYELTVDKAVERYLEAPGLSSKICQGQYFYFDEIAVLPGYRGIGIGKTLTSFMCESDKTKPILLRTKNFSTAFKMFLGFGGKVVLNISEDRVIMTIGQRS